MGNIWDSCNRGDANKSLSVYSWQRLQACDGGGIITYSINTYCGIQPCIDMSRSGRLGSLNGRCTWDGKCIMVVDHCIYFTQYDTYTF